MAPCVENFGEDMDDCFDVENPDKKELAKIYNDEKRYPWIFKQLGGYEDYCDRYKLHAIIKNIDRFNPKKILDNGCGAAVISRVLAKKGYQVTGFDISASIIDKIPKEKNLELVIGDADMLPFSDKTFDCIVSSEVLEHIKENEPSIREMHRVLADDGVVVITIPNWSCYDCVEGNFGVVTFVLRIVNSFLAVVGRGPIYKYGVNMHFHKMFPWQWKKKLNKLGFEVVKEQAVYLVPYIPKFRFVERWIYKIPYLFDIKVWFDDLLSPIWPFKYMGIGHLFVCRKMK
jgi:ubiquinone/menaquinone biosynthesis C-methylase UbiE